MSKNDMDTFLNQQAEKLKNLEAIPQKLDGLESYPLSASQCLYIHNFQTKSISFQKGVSEFLGYSQDEFNSQLVNSFFHPQDKAIVSRLIQASVSYAIENKFSQDAHLSLTYRIRKKNGEHIKILRQSKVFEADKDGHLVSNFSLLTDISYMDTSNCVEWNFDANYLDQAAFKRYVGHQYENFFSARQFEVIKGITEGLNSKEIADVLFISRHTVDTHRKNILKKARCKNSVELISFCKKNGLI